jgi:hypothetical protein
LAFIWNGVRTAAARRNTCPRSTGRFVTGSYVARRRAHRDSVSVAATERMSKASAGHKLEWSERNIFWDPVWQLDCKDTADTRTPSAGPTAVYLRLECQALRTPRRWKCVRRDE